MAPGRRTAALLVGLAAIVVAVALLGYAVAVQPPVAPQPPTQTPWVRVETRVVTRWLTPTETPWPTIPAWAWTVTADTFLPTFPPQPTATATATCETHGRPTAGPSPTQTPVVRQIIHQRPLGVPEEGTP